MAATLAVVGSLQSCGGSNPAGPTPPGPTPSVTAVAPNSGSTLGGTKVTVTGTNFTSAVSVSFGGVPATGVQVASATQLTATTGEHASGAVDVIVVRGTQRGTLAGAFTFVAPSKTPNESPTITSLKAQGSREDEPAQFADLGEEISITATVTDPESAPDSLTYEWSADIGTFSGTGAAVKWRAPTTGATPVKATLTLTVVESYQTINDSGLPVTAENRVTKLVTVSVHDSAKEVGDMSRLFLEDFSRQELSPDQIIRNFTDHCRGKANELDDVRNNQRTQDIQSWSVDAPQVTIKFGGECSFRARDGDACADVPVDWTSRCVNETNFEGEKVCDLGHVGRAKGIDQVSARYIDSRWWLCDSDFNGAVTDTTTGRLAPEWKFKH